ncbi:unnamed protein product [Miscanthus lutarioriparius]|uniref:DUF6598 domain-containing protein n=1 Tax=Miscanthus lutarioriparius TaxID=422564 RepID=A0A811RDV7_9POAL|nr:unnamed protein product [Miscanthus lutarioriparius]
MQFLRQMARKKKQNDRQRILEDTVLDFDPKQGGEYYTRFTFADLTKFDLDKECPKRGLALIGPNYVEIDLKIKDHQGQDKELSKGKLSINGIERRRLKQCVLESDSLATRLSTVDVLYGVVKDAVECTITIDVLQGDFNGKITAQTTSILNSLVLL